MGSFCPLFTEISIIEVPPLRGGEDWKEWRTARKWASRRTSRKTKSNASFDPQTRPQPCCIVHSNEQLPKSTSHCTNRHKLDFVPASVKEFSLSALPGHCKNVIALGVPKGKFVKANFGSCSFEWTIQHGCGRVWGRRKHSTSFYGSFFSTPTFKRSAILSNFLLLLVGGTSIIDILVNNGQNDPIFHKETNRHTRDK